MPHNIMKDPCRIVDSDDEDESHDQFYLSQSSMTRPATRQSEPKILDWDPVSNEDKFPGKFSRRKTAPSFEKAPSHHKPIFSGTFNLKSSSSSSSSSDSILELNKAKTVNTYTSDTPPESSPSNKSCFDPAIRIQENLKNFIYSTIPQEYPSFIRCCLRRDRDGIQKGFFPTFYLHAERPSDGKKLFLLAARKVAKVNRQSEYLITTDIATLSEKTDGPGYVGKLREHNIAGTEYTLYDNGENPNKYGHKHQNRKHGLRCELAAIIYNTNVLRLKGPREIRAVLPEIGYDVQPTKDEDGLLDQWHDRRLSYLLPIRNRSPVYNEKTKTHSLQFTGNRVVQTSIKNFQMVIETPNHGEEVVMQFGRLDKDTFACDYRYPLSAIQAFGIALSSFDSGLLRD